MAETCAEKSRIKVWKVLKKDASWKKCNWDYKHGTSAGRGKLFGQEDGGMEIESILQQEETSMEKQNSL